MPLSTTRPSTWWNTGLCVASSSSVRYDPARAHHVDRRLAGQHACGLHRRGVRAQHQAGVGGRDVERVHQPRAGWSGPKLSASKLNHSARARGLRRPRSPCRRTGRRSAPSAWSAGAGRRAERLGGEQGGLLRIVRIVAVGHGAANSLTPDEPSGSVRRRGWPQPAGQGVAQKKVRPTRPRPAGRVNISNMTCRSALRRSNSCACMVQCSRAEAYRHTAAAAARFRLSAPP
jgi:hypothetical protein